MKKKMDFETKAKLIYSVELGIFAVVFFVIAILKLTGVLGTNTVRAAIFNWVTLFGGTWLLVDLVWALLDKKRQKRIALLDKIIHAPAGAYLIAFDLFCLINKPSDPKVYQYGVPIVLGYLGLCYTFEAIYHFKYPVPGIVDAVEQEKNMQEQQNLEENKDNSSEEESEAINHDKKD